MSITINLNINTYYYLEQEANRQVKSGNKKATINTVLEGLIEGLTKEQIEWK